ncbi:hypothetical protein [Fretibacter rubidus]
MDFEQSHKITISEEVEYAQYLSNSVGIGLVTRLSKDAMIWCNGALVQ